MALFTAEELEEIRRADEEMDGRTRKRAPKRDRRAYYQANKERIKAKSLAYHYEHRDACLAAMRDWKRRKKEAQA